jgi:ABC-type multidrug transport system ATPase subunit
MEQVANRMLIIDRGRKMVEGDVEELVDPGNVVLEVDTTDNQSCYTQLLHSRWHESLQQRHNGKLHLRLARNDLPEFNKELVNMNVGVISLHPHNSLEEYFLSIISGKNDVEPATNRIV